jgi:hypothetical protein
MLSTRSIASLALAACLGLAAPAWSNVEHPRLVRVRLGPSLPVSALLVAGLDVVDVKDGIEAKLLEWPGDGARLARLGAVTETIDEDPGRTAAALARSELGARVAPEPVRHVPRPLDGVAIESPPPFGAGSMGGYWTTAEIKQKLDQLVLDDAHDVVANRIDTVGYSRGGRPIWGLQLGKHVDGPDDRPVVFYNALTHAREPGGMQTLFYFVDDLLSRYGTDPFATYLLDHRVIYVVPLVNPDGYAINEQTWFGGGGFGMWRKNTRDNNGNNVFETPPTRRPESQLRLQVGVQQPRLERHAERRDLPRPLALLGARDPGPARPRHRAPPGERALVPHLQRPHDPSLGLDHFAGRGHRPVQDLE